MTREEREKAIDLLDNLLGMVEDNQDNDYDKALKMGIESLRKEPSEDWHDIYSDEMTLEQSRQAVRDLREKLAECLRKEPCEDAVSRKAVLNLAKDLEFKGVKGLEHYKHRCIEIEDVEDLPPVTPELSSLREINEALTKRVQFLEDMNRYAMATPTRKKGKWITNPNKMKGTEIECNKCGVSALSKIGIQVCSDFCPNCGAEMENK